MKFQNPQTADALAHHPATLLPRKTQHAKNSKPISKQASPTAKPSRVNLKKEELLQKQRAQDLQSSITLVHLDSETLQPKTHPLGPNKLTQALPTTTDLISPNSAFMRVTPELGKLRADTRRSPCDHSIASNEASSSCTPENLACQR